MAAFLSGVALTVFGLLLIPLCKSIASLMFCLGFILPAGSGAISFGIIMGAITPQLPPKSVASVSGIINASSGMGNTILSPIINSLISTGGLMHGMLMLSIPTLLTLPAFLLLGKKSKPLKTAEASAITEETSIKAWFKKAMRSRLYIYLMVGFFTCGFHMAIITNHLPTQIQSFGFSGAATVPPVAGIIGKAFGAKSLAILFGLVFFIHQIGGFFGAWLGGVCFSATGSYTIIWCASLVFSILASAISFAIKEDSRA